ncbi:MAG: replicative DNA helicase [Planctomycetota bacterium]
MRDDSAIAVGVSDARPPHSVEAERAVLGSLLLDPSVAADVSLAVEDFFGPSHRGLYEIMLELVGGSGGIDPVVVWDRMQAVGGFREGPEWLLELAEAVPSANRARHYAGIVAAKATRRRVIEASAATIEDAAETTDEIDGDVSGLIERVESRLFEATRVAGGSDVASVGDVSTERLLEVEAAIHDGVAPGLATGYRDLDELTGGLHAGELAVVAGRPGMGKTALALSIARNVAAGSRAAEPKSVLIFSMEMHRSQIAARYLSMQSGVSMSKIARATLTPEEVEKVWAVRDTLAALPVHVDFSPGITIGQLRARCRRMVSRREGPPLGLVVVDYLQLMTTSGKRRENRQVEVSELSGALKATAKDLGVPVLVACQLNRAPDSRDDKRPRPSDLRESGSIEQDADLVGLLYREGYYHQSESNADREWRMQNQGKENRAELIVAKQRNGPTDTVSLTWDGPRGTFRTYSEFDTSRYGRGRGAAVDGGSSGTSVEGA